MNRRVSPITLAIALSAALPALGGNDIFRCASPEGVTYQQVPCPGSSVEQRANVPTEFPPPNVEERNRLFEREAALYQRLEARRDREVQEAALRDAREGLELERARLTALAAEAAQPQYLLVVPLRSARLQRGQPFRRAAAP